MLWTVRAHTLTAGFQILSSGQGSQGIMGQLSKQELHAVFGTTNTDDAIIKVLEQGTLQAGSTYTCKADLQRFVATTTAVGTRATPVPT